MIYFRLDPSSGVPVYLQVVRQVRNAVMTGSLSAGDQLPTVREVVATLTINPNTVLKAYSELENEGLVTTRVGIGTFVATSNMVRLDPAVLQRLRPGIRAWVRNARRAGLDRNGVDALVAAAFDEELKLDANELRA